MLKYITFYVQKYIAHLVACYGPQLVCDGPLGAPAFVKIAYCYQLFETLIFNIWESRHNDWHTHIPVIIAVFPYSI